jgi:hypothetical protein
MPYGKPVNKILVAGTPIIDECVAEGTNVKPGLLVVKGTSDNQVVLAGAGALNVLGVIDVDSRYNMAEAFPDKHPVKVLKGPIVAVLTLAASQTIAKGRRMQAAANGQVQAFPATPAAGDIEKLVGYAEESVTTAAGETKPIMVRLVI